jgi:transposase
VVWVSPKLVAHVRDSARSYGKFDPIDALAVARAALREPDLPTARLDGIERELRLLVDHREDLVAERTRIISRLRWHLHKLDPGWTAPTKLERHSAFDKVKSRRRAADGMPCAGPHPG